MPDVKITLSGFSLAEKLDLEKTLGAAEILAERAAVTGRRHGNLGLYDVIVALGPSLITVLGIWLSKNRGQVRQDEEIRAQFPDGSTERRRIVYKRQTENTDPDVVQQLTALAQLRTGRAPVVSATRKKTPAKKKSPAKRR